MSDASPVVPEYIIQSLWDDGCGPAGPCKRCKRCERERPLGRFYQGRAVCKDCVRETRARDPLKDDGSCSHSPCERAAACGGYCDAHYLRKRNGRPMDAPLQRRGRVGENRANNGVKRCASCEAAKPVAEFSPCGHSFDGYYLYCRACASMKSSLTRYRFTMEGYRSLLADQDGRCAICRTDEFPGGARRPSIDHDHETGVVRGLLCGTCNVMLGHVRDDPTVLLSAIRYLCRNGKPVPAGLRLAGEPTCVP